MIIISSCMVKNNILAWYNVCVNLQLFNTLTQAKQSFIPIDPKSVSMYVCGPTVYDRPHVGNARPAVVFDVLFRMLKMRYDVTYVSNITDIDDKIINAAIAQNVSIDQITSKALEAYNHDMRALNVLPPTFTPKATEYVDRMCDVAVRLIQSGYAYVSDNGDVMFDIKSFKDYGRLARVHSNISDDIEGSSDVDFVLWKNIPADQLEQAQKAKYCWETPGALCKDEQTYFGRPGWHLECTAMSTALLGDCFDIHGGGADLMFPHHENERAQTCCYSAKTECANYWMHNGLIQFEGGKMSKSLGNVLFLSDVSEQTHALSVRLFFLQTHYKQTLYWSENGLKLAHERLTSFYKKLRNWECEEVVCKQSDEFIAALENDLNTPLALTLVDKYLQTHAFEKAYSALSVLGLIYDGGVNAWLHRRPLTDEQAVLLEERMECKNQKNYAKADQLRKQLFEQGVIVEDVPDGYQWHCI